jgi:hypothetical protein
LFIVFCIIIIIVFLLRAFVAITAMCSLQLARSTYVDKYATVALGNVRKPMPYELAVEHACTRMTRGEMHL